MWPKIKGLLLRRMLCSVLATPTKYVCQPALAREYLIDTTLFTMYGQKTEFN